MEREAHEDALPIAELEAAVTASSRLSSLSLPAEEELEEEELED